MTTAATGASNPPVSSSSSTSSTGSNGTPELTDAEKAAKAAAEEAERARKAAVEAEFVAYLTAVIMMNLPTPVSAKAKGTMLTSPFAAPGIAPPKGASLMTLFEHAKGLTDLSQQTRLDTERDKIISTKQASEEYHVRLQRMKDEQDKQAQAATKNDNTTGILKWFKRIAPYAMIALSVAATVATAGAGAPLIAAATIAMTSYQLAQQISQDVGGPSLSAADGLALGFSTAAQKWGGMSKEDADKLGETLSGAVMVAATLVSAKSLATGPKSMTNLLQMLKDNPAMRRQVVGHLAPRLVAPMLMALDPKFAGNMVGGAAKLDGRMSNDDADIFNASVTAGLQLAMGIGMGRMASGAGKVAQTVDAADDIAKVSKAAVQASKYAAGVSVSQAVVTTGNGAVGVTNSVLELETEDLKELAAQLGVTVDELIAVLDQLQQYFQWYAESLQKIVSQMDDSNGLLSEEISKAHDTNRIVSSNIAA